MGLSLKKITRSVGKIFKPIAEILPAAGAIAGAYLGPVGAAAGGALGRFVGGRISGDEHGIESLKGAAKAGAISGLTAGALTALGNLSGAGMGQGPLASLFKYMPSGSRSLASILSSASGGGGAGSRGLLSYLLGGGQGSMMPQAGGTTGGGGGFLGTLNKWLPLANVASNFITGQQTAEAAEKAAEYADPFRDQRSRYQDELNALMADPSAIEREPGYQFELEQGTNAIDRALASQGRYFSGARPLELTKFAQGLASTRFSSAVDRLSKLAGAQFAPGGGTEAMYTGAVKQGQNIEDLLASLRLLTSGAGNPSPQLNAISGMSSIPQYNLGSGNMGYPSALDARYM